jgi:hypothetical protein
MRNTIFYASCYVSFFYHPLRFNNSLARSIVLDKGLLLRHVSRYLIMSSTTPVRIVSPWTKISVWDLPNSNHVNNQKKAMFGVSSSYPVVNILSFILLGKFWVDALRLHTFTKRGVTWYVLCLIAIYLTVSLLFSGIWCWRVCEDLCCCLLSYSTLYTARWVPTFRRKLRLHFETECMMS